MLDEIPEKLAPLRRAAVVLGVPSAWLREQAEQGALPGLRAGNRWLFDVESVRAELRRMASSSVPSDEKGGAR